MKFIVTAATVLLFIACSKPPSGRPQALSATKPPEATVVTGQWDLRMGKAVEKLQIKEDNGAISGVRHVDPHWHGMIAEVKGIHSGEKVEFSCANDGALFTYKGTVTADGEMSGEVHVNTGEMAGETLWVAHRINADIDGLNEFLDLARSKGSVKQ